VNVTKRLVYVDEAADILGLSKEAIRKRIKRGTIDAKKDAGGKWLIAVEDDVGDAGEASGQAGKDLTVKILLEQVEDLKRERDYYRNYFLNQNQKLLQPGQPWWKRFFRKDSFE